MTQWNEQELGAFLDNEFGDRYLYPVNRQIFNKIGSKGVFEKFFPDDFLVGCGFRIIIGTDSGALLKYVQGRGIDTGCKVVFVENQEILNKISEVIDLRRLDKRITVVPPTGFLAALDRLDFENYVYIDKVFIHEAICAREKYYPGYGDLLRFVRGQLDLKIWEVRSKIGSQDFILSQLQNLGENIWSADCLNNIFPGKCAVILGGGPSLDDILPWVQAHRQDLVVIAVSRVSKRLQDIGLQPDIVVAVDPVEVSFIVSKEMLNWENRTLFLNLYHVHPGLLGQWCGPKVYLGHRLPWTSKLNDNQFKVPGPTVTHIALEKAMDMGFSKIVLAGVDLCKSRDGYSHAAGSHERHKGESFTEDYIQVETNGGWLAETTTSYAQGIIPLNEQAKRAQQRGISVINPAVGAAKIPHVLYQAIDEIDVPALEAMAWDTIQAHLPEETSKIRAKYYKSLLDEVGGFYGELVQIKKLVLSALDANERLFGRKGQPADFHHKLRMDKIEERLNTEFTRISLMVKEFGAENFLKLMRPDDDEWSDEEIEEAGRAYYTAYLDSIQSFMDLLVSCQARLRSRLDEENERPEWLSLANQWRQDGLPGRLKVVQKQRHLEDRQDDIDPSIVAALEADYSIKMTPDRHLLPRFVELIDNIGKVRSRLYDLFKSHDIPTLKRLVEALAILDGEDSGSLCLLGQGYLAELEGDSSAALEHYQGLFEYPERPELEDGLRRIASLALDTHDFECALGALDCLSQISITYSPQYADLLWILGEKDNALEIYAVYLGKMPQDLVSMLKLGRYYLELNHPEGAEMAFQYVLDNDAGNQAAQTLLIKAQELRQSSPST